MKLWKFYYIGDTDDIMKDVDPDNIVKSYIDDLSTKYPLYAVTTNKRMAAGFMGNRCMKRFLTRVDDDIDYSEFCNAFLPEKQSLILDEYILNTKDDNGKEREINVVCTDYEYQLISDCELDWIAIDEEFWNSAPSIFIFKKGVKDALNCLQYESMRKLSANPAIIEKEYGEEFDYEGPDVDTDQLSLLISMFHGTFF